MKQNLLPKSLSNIIVNPSKALNLIMLLLFSSFYLYAQNPGDSCDPTQDVGWTSRILSVTGIVNINNADGEQTTGQVGTVIHPGSTIETGNNETVELALEDGTNERLSRLTLKPNTKAIVHGGLVCEDLRPKVDGGRWWVREIDIELDKGEIQVQIDPEVSRNFKNTINTPNSEININRRTQEEIVFSIKSHSLKNRKKVYLHEHPFVLSRIQHILQMFGGRSYDELQPQERQLFQTQAASVALETGLVDLDLESLAQEPTISPMVSSIAGGKSFDDLEDDVRDHLINSIASLAIQQNLIDFESLMIYDHPDKYTHVRVESGNLRVRNSIRPYERDEIIAVESGHYTEITGIDPPTTP